MSVRSNLHQVRCRLAYRELHLLFSSSFGPTHLAPPFSPRPSSTLGGTIRLTSTCAFRLQRGADGTFLWLSGWPGIYCLQPIAPWDAREVCRPFLQMDLSTSKLVHCSAPAQDKITRNNSQDFYLRRWVRAVEGSRLP